MATECACAVLWWRKCYMVTRHDVSRRAIFDARLGDFDLDALRPLFSWGRSYTQCSLSTVKYFYLATTLTLFTVASFSLCRWFCLTAMVPLCIVPVNWVSQRRFLLRVCMCRRCWTTMKISRPLQHNVLKKNTTGKECSSKHSPINVASSWKWSLVQRRRTFMFDFCAIILERIFSSGCYLSWSIHTRKHYLETLLKIHCLWVSTVTRIAWSYPTCSLTVARTLISLFNTTAS